MLALEDLSGGMLLDRLKKGAMSEHHAAAAFYQILTCIMHMHHEGYVHRCALFSALSSQENVFYSSLLEVVDDSLVRLTSSSVYCCDACLDSTSLQLVMAVLPCEEALRHGYFLAIASPASRHCYSTCKC